MLTFSRIMFRAMIFRKYLFQSNSFSSNDIRKYLSMEQFTLSQHETNSCTEWKHQQVRKQIKTISK